MPKMKTKKSVAKRFRMTKKGKVKRARAFRGHICVSKSAKRRRRLRAKGMVHDTNTENIKKQLPYG